MVSNFIVQTLRNKYITIYGNGSQTRSFFYVDDLIECMVRFMDASTDFIGPMNTGNPNEFTIKELALKVIDLTGSGSRLIFKELPSDAPRQRQPDISQARERLGREPRTGLDAGLGKTIGYFDSLLSERRNEIR